MSRGVVTQMRLRTLLPVEGWPSSEVALMKGQPCGACLAAKVGTFSGINVRRRLVVFNLTKMSFFLHFSKYEVHYVSYLSGNAN